jgi:hypothetical protein
MEFDKALRIIVGLSALVLLACSLTLAACHLLGV